MFRSHLSGAKALCTGWVRQCRCVSRWRIPLTTKPKGFLGQKWISFDWEHVGILGPVKAYIYDFSDWVPWCYILKSHWRSQMGVDFGRLRVVLPVAIIEVLETISGGPSLHQLMCWFYEFYLGFYTSWGGCLCLPPSVFVKESCRQVGQSGW